MNDPIPLTFRHRDRLHGSRAFAAVYEAKARKHAGPLSVAALPNDCGHHRLGLSVARRVGTAPRRNLHKRMLREAFRLDRHAWPTDGTTYDWVVSIREHDPASLDAYRRWLADAVEQLHALWDKRSRRR